MLASLFEQRAIRDPGWNRWAAGDDLNLGGRRKVGEDAAMGLLAVHSAVKVISDTLATLPVDIYRETGGSRSEVLNPPTWVNNPTLDLNRIEFISQIVVSMLLRGNSYSLIVRGASGQVEELYPLHPDWVTVKRTELSRESSRTYWINGINVPADRILHIPEMMMPGAIVGVDPITSARDAIGLGIDAQTYGAKFFQQSAIPAGVIKVPGEKMSLQQARDLAQQWRGLHGGPNRSSLPAVLTGGAEYQPITITNEQAQFLETRRYTDSQVYRLFGLGNPLNTDASSNASLTYANVEQLSTDVVRYALMPRAVRIERALTALLPRPQFWRFNFDAFLRADTKTRFEAYRVANPSAVILTEDEIRELEDLSPIPGDRNAVPLPDEAQNANP
jgi:HK97 family phage portal protein